MLHRVLQNGDMISFAVGGLNFSNLQRVYFEALLLSATCLLITCYFVQLALVLCEILEFHRYRQSKNHSVGALLPKARTKKTQVEVGITVEKYYGYEENKTTGDMKS